MYIVSAFLPSLLHNFSTTLSKPSLFDRATLSPFACVRYIIFSTSTISGCAEPNVSFHPEKNLARPWQKDTEDGRGCGRKARKTEVPNHN